MKKLLFVLGSAVLLTACQLPFTNSSPSPESATQTSAQNSQELAEISTAIQSGQSVQCTMTKNDGTTTIDYLVKGKKMKVATVTTNADEKAGNMISDGVYIYTWQDGEAKGIKMKMPTEAQLKDATEAFGQSIPDFSKQESQDQYKNMGYGIECQAKSVSDAEFVPPTNIEFTDMSAMMQKATDSMKNAKNSLTPEQQEAIKQQSEQMMKQYQN